MSKLRFKRWCCSTLFIIFAITDLGWAQATCQTGPSWPRRSAARVWVPS